VRACVRAHVRARDDTVCAKHEFIVIRCDSLAEDAHGVMLTVARYVWLALMVRVVATDRLRYRPRRRGA